MNEERLNEWIETIEYAKDQGSNLYVEDTDFFLEVFAAARERNELAKRLEAETPEPEDDPGYDPKEIWRDVKTLNELLRAEYRQACNERDALKENITRLRDEIKQSLTFGDNLEAENDTLRADNEKLIQIDMESAKEIGSLKHQYNTLRANNAALREVVVSSMACMEAMSHKAYEIQLEGTTEWDQIAGTADIYGTIDECVKVLAYTPDDSLNEDDQ